MSLTTRAALAVAFFFGFYILAFLIIGTLVGLGVLGIYLAWEKGNLNFVLIKLELFCLVGAYLITRAIIPERVKFVAPGPLLTREAHPRLFETIDSVAEALDQNTPDEVYLIPNMNAFVTQRGGFMGQGGKKVMGLGLPVMQSLSIPEFKGVIAHEFGHFYGGDVTLGPWVYKTREVIERTLQGLEEHSSWLQAPFSWYGKAFLRISQSVSRNQEFAADLHAAKLVGAKPLISSLKKIYGLSMAFDEFWSAHYAPALNSGYRVPMTKGFKLFISVPEINSAIKEEIKRELEEGVTDKYDSHPSIGERIKALQAIQTRVADQEKGGAITLINNVPDLEYKTLLTMADEKTIKGLKPLKWDDLGPELWVPYWRDIAHRYSTILKGITPGDFQKLSDNDYTRKLIELLPADEEYPIPLEERPVNTFAAAFATMLFESNWRLNTRPGEPITFERDGFKIRPFEAAFSIAEGKTPGEEWTRICADAGVLDWKLERAAQTGA